MRQLLESLEACVVQSSFVSDRIGRFGWNDVRALYHRRKWGDYTWWHVMSAAKLEVGDELVSDLAAKLEPVLAGFRHAETGRIGNGLFLLLGGLGTLAHPTLSHFSKEILIPGAVKLGTERMVGLLLDWARGEPLRFQINALLEGVRIDGTLELEEGISVYQLPKSSSDLPASLPAMGMGATTTDYLGGVVLSMNCETSPALYLPTEEDLGGALVRELPFNLASGAIPDLSSDSFCESMSLACNGFVN